MGRHAADMEWVTAGQDYVERAPELLEVREESARRMAIVDTRAILERVVSGYLAACSRWDADQEVGLAVMAGVLHRQAPHLCDVAMTKRLAALEKLSERVVDEQTVPPPKELRSFVRLAQDLISALVEEGGHGSAAVPAGAHDIVDLAGVARCRKCGAAADSVFVRGECRGKHDIVVIERTALCRLCGARADRLLPAQQCRGKHDIELIADEPRCRKCGLKANTIFITQDCRGNHDVVVIADEPRCRKCGAHADTIFISQVCRGKHDIVVIAGKARCRRCGAAVGGMFLGPQCV